MLLNVLLDVLKLLLFTQQQQQLQQQPNQKQQLPRFMGDPELVWRSFTSSLLRWQQW
jgi:hypothetical protein